MVEEIYKEFLNEIKELEKINITSKEEKNKDKFLVFLVVLFLLQIVVFIKLGIDNIIFNLILVVLIFVEMKLSIKVEDLKEKNILQNFYKVDNVENKVKLIYLENLDILDELYNELALCFMLKPNPQTLKFIYNWLNNKNVLKKQSINIYAFTGKDLNKKFGYAIMPNDRSILSISLNEVNITENDKILLSQEFDIIRARFFNDIVHENLKSEIKKNGNNRFKYICNYQGEYSSSESNIEKIEIKEKDLYIYIDWLYYPQNNMCDYIVKDCLIILKNFKLISEYPKELNFNNLSKLERKVYKKEKIRIQKLSEELTKQNKKMYLSFKDFCSYGSEDTYINYEEDKKELYIQGYGTDESNALWINLRLICEKITYYWNEVYNYSNGQKIEDFDEIFEK